VIVADSKNELVRSNIDTNALGFGVSNNPSIDRNGSTISYNVSAGYRL
jgi:hypothetical protein